jgi:hypothetical protein
MGLGPSWIALSLLNDFAACASGVLPEEFAVNGDDLIALWTPARCLKYEKMLRRIRLVPNLKKSFRGRA